MIAAFRYELLRLATLRTTSRLPLAAVAAAAFLGVASALAVSADASPRTVALLRLLAVLPVLGVAAALGAQSSGEERHHRLRAVTLAVVPHRFRLAAAKAGTVALLSALVGALGSVAAAAGYSLAIAWAYAGDRTLIPESAVADPMIRGLAPAAAAAAAAGLFGLALGWLTLWYRTAVGVSVAAVVLAAPLAAGRLAHRTDFVSLLGNIESAIRVLPGVGTLLNPRILSVWPTSGAGSLGTGSLGSGSISTLGATGLASHVGHVGNTGLSPMPPTSLATTVLIAALALVGLVAGVVKWQRD